MKKYSKDWTMDEDDIIRHDEGKFYEVVKGPYGNPVIFQHQGGNVFLTMVGDQVLCEEETVYEDGVTPTKQWRAVRASLDNPDQPGLLGEPIYLGEGHSNTQRMIGPADKYYFVNLAENPDEGKYRLMSMCDVVEGKDNFGKCALFMYLARFGRVRL